MKFVKTFRERGLRARFSLPVTCTSSPAFAYTRNVSGLNGKFIARQKHERTWHETR